MVFSTLPLPYYLELNMVNAATVAAPAVIRFVATHETPVTGVWYIVCRLQQFAAISAASVPTTVEPGDVLEKVTGPWLNLLVR